jgi:hypothetical protein
MWISITVFSLIGSYIPVVLWHAGGLSGWSLFGGLVGSIFGIWAAFRLNDYI